MESLKGCSNNVINDDISIFAEGAALLGDLHIPEKPLGLVIFAHGSGSSRKSPRNRLVGKILNKAGIATLLTDLLTPEEEIIDNATRQLRFDIPLLSNRLAGITHWVNQYPKTAGFCLGYFGASTGAAAALIAAAKLPGRIQAVVSRGGRPDLADKYLRLVKTPTLLIVGSLDEAVITLNQGALKKLGAMVKQLQIIEGATHLFEEPGKLEEVADFSRKWFLEYLK